MSVPALQFIFAAPREKTGAFADDTGQETPEFQSFLLSFAKSDVCLQNTSKSHSYHLKIWHLLIGNGASLRSSNQWQLKEF